MNFKTALLAAMTCGAIATPSWAQTSLRPPSVPLVTHDPFLSIWSNTNNLYDSSTAHWTGRAQGISSLVRIDGKPFRLMGDTPTQFAPLPQTNVSVTPTRTIYTFIGEGVKVKLTFLSPLIPSDLDLLSRPLSYITWDVEATDGARHDVSVYFDASSALAVNEPSLAYSVRTTKFACASTPCT
ncbi:DUF5127 domain-containing protein, partial [bacterium]